MKLYFENQTRLLLKIIGTVLSNSSYALKGGTAINFFHANMPRLSVDIDLAYTKINSRSEFLEDNLRFYEKMIANLQRQHPSCTFQVVKTQDLIPKQILVTENNVTIKVESNLIIRGTVYPCAQIQSCAKIEENYGLKFKLNTLSLEDLFSGKFCAALDRQHPRDLFDVMMFFQKNTITETLKKAFLVYLISGNRPISELIKPNRLNQKNLFQREFVGMTDIAVSYEELEESREMLILNIDKALTQQDRQFLLSFKLGKPDWSILNIDHIQHMPSIKWKLMNIKQMNLNKHTDAVKKLEQKLT